MKYVLIADTHGKVDMTREFKKDLDEADGLLVAGDITHFGGGKEARSVLESFGIPFEKIMAVSGNCDHLEVVDFLKDSGITLEGEGKRVGDIGFFGLGGSGTTPFDTPNERPEAELARELNHGYEMIKDQRVKVLVTHSPPLNTSLDRTSGGIHAGSSAVASLMEASPVDFVLCGHIHEAVGSETSYGARMVNPGPLHMGGWAILDLEGGDIIPRGKL
jgi:Icc-related predicted phosphoesterase